MPTDSDSPLLPHGGYESLRSYRVAEAVYDATVVFCDRFIDKKSRTHDQMVQAARSGVRNISEGSGAAATSKKMEMKLTNVARSSLNDELARDYESFLLQRGLRVWPKNSKPCLAMRERLKLGRARGFCRQGGSRAGRQCHALRRASGVVPAPASGRPPGPRVPGTRRLHRASARPPGASPRRESR